MVTFLIPITVRRLQRAAIDRDGAGVAYAVGGEGEGAGAALGNRPRATDSSQRLIRRTAMNKRPAVADSTGVGAATQCSGAANLQRARIDVGIQSVG